MPSLTFFPTVICYNVCIFLYVFNKFICDSYIYIYIYIYMTYVGDGLPTSITNQMVYVCCGPCGHARVLCNVHLPLWLVRPHPHESEPNGPGHMGRAIWARKYYGIFRYVAVTYGMGIVRFVLGIIIIQVIYHTPFLNSHMRSYAITNRMNYVCHGPCGHTRVLCNVRLLLSPVWPHTHESGPYGPSKYCGILWYVAVIYGMGTDRNVSGTISTQVIYHRPFSQQSYADICVFRYVFCNLSVILLIYLYAGDNLPPSITNSMINVTADVAIQETCAGNVRSPLWPLKPHSH